MRPLQMRPTKSPDDTYTFGNLVAVSPAEFQSREDIYVIINGDFVLSARPHPRIQPGQISFSEPQRTWIQIALTDLVTVQPFDPFSSQGAASYLSSLTVEVTFAGRKSTDEPYEQDDLGKAFTKVFRNQIFAPRQQFLMDYKSIPLKLTVRTVELTDLSSLRGGAPADSEPQTLSGPYDRGILTTETFINFTKDARSPINLKGSLRRPATSALVRPDFKFESLGIGGLDNEFSDIFRRAFISRLFPPALISSMGLQHVRGLLLYGPPGTGKTLIARQIGKMLNAREPKVINGPEVLNKFVGQSEENIRKLFADAEAEQKEKGEESGLHIIIFDELDAICRQRNSGVGGGTGVGDSVVNQLLSKLDGVNQLNNILLIGMTNRKDMIDDALLRPGRLEVHVEISLPDEKGREQILKIHTADMGKKGILGSDVDTRILAKETKNFTGAELSGLVRSACSHAFSRHIKVGTTATLDDSVANVMVKNVDFDNALEEIKPQFGSNFDELSRCYEGGIMRFNVGIKDILTHGQEYTAQVRAGAPELLTLLIHGAPQAGKTALAAKIAMDTGFPLMKMVRPIDLVGMNDMEKIQHLRKVTSDAYKSPLNVVIFDNIERLIEYVPVGPRFSSAVLSALQAILQHKPPKGRRVLFIATTSNYGVLKSLDFRLNAEIAVPRLMTKRELGFVMIESRAFNEQECKAVFQNIEEVVGPEEPSIGIGKVLQMIETAKSSQDKIGRFAQLVTDAMAAGTD